jgi:hypothetical protein
MSTAAAILIIAGQEGNGFDFDRCTLGERSNLKC